MRAGIDIGGTKAEAVVIDERDRIVARVRRPSLRGAAGVGVTVRGVLDDLGRTAGARVTTVGIGIPGQIVDGRVRHAVNLDLADIDLAGELTAALGVPVRVENDVNVAALGAAAVRSAAHREAGLTGYLNLGTGVAAGLVLDGRLWSGAGGTAGEVGHVPIDPAGDDCPCGQRGCIETFAGGGAVVRRWNRGADQTVGDVFDAADDGDAAAQALRDRLAYGAAAAVRLLVLTADPAMIVIGGGVAQLGERLRDAVRAELVRSAERSPFLQSLQLDERVSLLPPGSVPGALGAALAGPNAPVFSHPGP